jgi:hypothetical protein
MIVDFNKKNGNQEIFISLSVDFLIRCWQDIDGCFFIWILEY